jgi:rSAM/selenodomain-associated transferase 1
MSCAIAVMAKAPRPGLCKTRLVPPLSPAQAADLSREFLRDTTDNLRAAAETMPIAPYVAYAPAGTQHLFDGVLTDGTGLLLADGSLDAPPGVQGFGRCLLHAVESLLARGHASVCVLNADSPTLPTKYLRQAAAWLAEPGDRAVMGPAEDGGYYLLGMKQAHAQLFAGISWSTARVAAETRGRALEAGLELLELPKWYDVDDAASLQRLQREMRGEPGDRFAAPRTAAWLAGVARDVAAE